MYTFESIATDLEEIGLQCDQLPICHLCIDTKMWFCMYNEEVMDRSIVFL